MKGKDYLEIRRKQDELLSQINDSTPVDDPKIKELLSLQEECDEFERENVHVGYEELNVELDIKTIVKVIRMAHEEGMNASDFVSIALLEEYMDETEELIWTTNLIKTDDYKGTGYPVIIPEEAMKKRGWKEVDFVRVTLTEDTLTLKNLHIE